MIRTLFLAIAHWNKCAIVKKNKCENSLDVNNVKMYMYKAITHPPLQILRKSTYCIENLFVK